ncbi:chemotaxis protein CheW [Chrysiogenes arsenatis]|uniref:chemotaxis protein CheW n=1 Tax=Chrysiogenes arsenatis TaxID=309797 RepID=UPI0004282CF5|nr:chemotaxis protein CheW [Chrysiogenes arsenatis]
MTTEAQGKKTSEENENLDSMLQLVGFTLGSEEYCIDILSVQEINKRMHITRVPKALPYVKGVINLRGKVISVIDLRRRFHLPEENFDNNTRIMVIDLAKETMGFIVDSVTEVIRIPVKRVDPTPPLIGHISNEYLLGVGKTDDRLLIILDLNRVAGFVNEDGRPYLSELERTIKKAHGLLKEEAPPRPTRSAKEKEAEPKPKAEKKAEPEIHGLALAEDRDASASKKVSASSDNLDDLIALELQKREEEDEIRLAMLAEDRKDREALVARGAAVPPEEVGDLDDLIAIELRKREEEDALRIAQLRQMEEDGEATALLAKDDATHLDDLIALELEKRERENEERLALIQGEAGKKNSPSEDTSVTQPDSLMDDVYEADSAFPEVSGDESVIQDDVATSDDTAISAIMGDILSQIADQRVEVNRITEEHAMHVSLDEFAALQEELHAAVNPDLEHDEDLLGNAVGGETPETILDETCETLAEPEALHELPLDDEDAVLTIEDSADDSSVLETEACVALDGGVKVDVIEEQPVAEAVGEIDKSQSTPHVESKADEEWNVDVFAADDELLAYLGEVETASVSDAPTAVDDQQELSDELRAYDAEVDELFEIDETLLSELEESLDFIESEARHAEAQKSEIVTKTKHASLVESGGDAEVESICAYLDALLQGNLDATFDVAPEIETYLGQIQSLLMAARITASSARDEVPAIIDSLYESSRYAESSTNTILDLSERILASNTRFLDDFGQTQQSFSALDPEKREKKLSALQSEVDTSIDNIFEIMGALEFQDITKQRIQKLEKKVQGLKATLVDMRGLIKCLDNEEDDSVDLSMFFGEEEVETPEAAKDQLAIDALLREMGLD